MENLFANAILLPLSKEAVMEISQWEYNGQYAAYSYKGHTDEYLSDQRTWGSEQFYLTDGHTIFGQVACQFEGEDLWVGWSMAPQLCGHGYGSDFISSCIQQIRNLKDPTGRILLRVVHWNKRAIKAYSKAGFQYVETIQDEIAYSGVWEDFYVMEFHQNSSFELTTVKEE